MAGPPLLATKLHVPAPRLRLVDRPRVWDVLDAGAEGALTVVSGPAGSGKTVAVATWAEARIGPSNTGWVSLEATENDPVRFWLYVLEAIRLVEPAVGDRTRALLPGVARSPGEALLPLIDDLDQCERPVLLVLDDYHEVENDEIHTSLGFLVDHLPTSTHLIVTSRTIPPLGLAARRVRGEVVEIGPSDLRFSTADAADLMMGLGVELDDVAIRGLTERTEGWAAGLYLAALSLRGHEHPAAFVEDFAGTDRHVIDFLVSEVLDRLEDDVRTFLRRTSHLSRMSAELCDAVVGSPASQRMLEELERTNMFVVPLDEHRRWYRYHHLFADLLSFELNRTEPGIAEELHGRAGDWYRRNGVEGLAITHLIAAGRHSEAVALILTSARPHFHSGQWQTVQRWIEALPAEVVAAEPRLALAMGWALFSGGMPQAVAQWVESAETGDTSLVTPGDGLTVAAEAQLLRALTLRAHGDFAGAYHAAERARELTAGSDAPRRFVAHAALGIAQYWDHQAEAGRANLAEALPELHRHRDRLALAELMTLGVLAAIELDDGNRARAEALCEQARELIAEQDVGRCHLAAMITAVDGRLLLLSGDLDGAATHLARALALGVPAADPAPVVYARRLLSELHHHRGRVGEARGELAEARRVLENIEAPGLTAMVIEAQHHLRRPSVGADVTGRELELLQLLPTDLTRREIAEELHVSAETVKTHARSLYRKLGVSSREACVERARDEGLV